MGASSIRCVGMSLRGSSESMRCRRQATSYPRWRADAGGWVASLFAVLIEVYSRLAVVVSRSFQSHTALPEETGVGHSHGEHSLQMILHILRTSGLLELKFVRRRRRRAITSRLSRWAFGCTAKAGACPGKGEETRALGFCSMLGGPGSRRPSRRPALRVCECAHARPSRLYVDHFFSVFWQDRYVMDEPLEACHEAIASSWSCAWSWRRHTLTCSGARRLLRRPRRSRWNTGHPDKFDSSEVLACADHLPEKVADMVKEKLHKRGPWLLGLGLLVMPNSSSSTSIKAVTSVPLTCLSYWVPRNVLQQMRQKQAGLLRLVVSG